jgi:hypothetical protein
MSEESTILEKIDDDKPVRIFLPVKGSSELLRAQCLYRKAEPPHFSLLFRAGCLPVEEIDLKRSCLVTVDLGGPAVSLQAKILELVDSQSLAMVLEKSVNYEQMREYFRVDAATEVVCKSLSRVGHDAGWSVAGETVDISGSGLLVIFPEDPPDHHQCRLEITIPGATPRVVPAMASRIRSRQRDDGSYEVAYHFIDISGEDQDAIIGCCLTLQRKQLQLKVRVRGG